MQRPWFVSNAYIFCGALYPKKKTRREAGFSWRAERESGGSLGRNLVPATGDAVLRIDVDQFRLVLGQFDFVVDGKGGDDQDIARCGPAGSRTVDRNDARSALGANGIGGETLAIVYV